METELFERFFEVEDRHWWFVGRRRIVIDQLKRHSCLAGRDPQRDASPAFRMLDLGCGTGGVLTHLNDLGCAYGLDPSDEAMNFCKERGLAITRGSGVELPFAERVFDAVLALDVIEHVEDDVALLREARRVLRPGGIVVLTVPALPWLWSDHDVVNHHYRRYVRSTLDRSVRAGGFTPVHTSYYNSFLLPLAVARKVAHRASGGGEHHLESLPGPLNSVLRAVLTSELPLIRHVEIPLGASLVCTARRS